MCARYPEARAIQRKVIFHAGPTNSGKTYQAIQRYLTAKTGVYCGPLKLLAHEIFEKTNDMVGRSFIFGFFSSSSLSSHLGNGCLVVWASQSQPKGISFSFSYLLLGDIFLKSLYTLCYVIKLLWIKPSSAKCPTALHRVDSLLSWAPCCVFHRE